MAEIQSTANPDFLQWAVGVIGVLFAVCGGLIAYVAKMLRNDVNKKANKNDLEKLEAEMLSKYKHLRDRYPCDHDRLTVLHSEHKLNHER